MILDNFNAHLPVQLTEQTEDLLYQIAQEMGILVTTEEAEALGRLSESALLEDQNIVRLNSKAKLSGLTVRSALVIAQQKKDALFAKYARAAALKRQLRDMIVKKYGAQATVTARKLLASAGRRNLVDLPARASSFSHPESRG